MYRAIIFGGYDTLTEWMDNSKNESTKKSVFQAVKKFLGGYCIAATAGIAVYPFDTMRQRMIVTTGEKKSYDSWTEQISKIRNLSQWHPELKFNIKLTLDQSFV